MLILLYFCRAVTMLINAAGESRGDGDNDGLGRKKKNCAEGHNRKACGTRGRFYRGSEMEQGRLVHTAREPSTLLMLKRSLTGEVFFLSLMRSHFQFDFSSMRLRLLGEEI